MWLFTAKAESKSPHLLSLLSGVQSGVECVNNTERQIGRQIVTGFGLSASVVESGVPYKFHRDQTRPAAHLSDVLFLFLSLALARCAQALRAAPLSRPDHSAAAGLPMAACRLAPLMAAESVLSRPVLVNV